MAEPILRHQGNLKIYLGYAAGVGKTYQMLTEVHQLKHDGIDVVLGYFEPHGRKDTIAHKEGLELIPCRRIQYRGTTFGEMDTEAILKRRPQTCAIDEFAHTNIPGSERTKRWEDVQVLLDAGINVLTTLNVQHLESLNDLVWQITGVRVRETIPDWVVKQADEVVMVDLPPEALLNRLRRGVIYAPDKVEQALQNFFKESTLVVLRELTLRQAAHEVDVRQGTLDKTEVSQEESGPNREAGSPQGEQPTDRILIYITPDPSTAMLIRRGRRVADYLKADCFAVSVANMDDKVHMSPAEREALEKHLNFARNLRIETQIVQGPNIAKALADFARLHKVTQIFLVRPRRSAVLPFLDRDIVQQVVRLAHDIQITVVAERLRTS